MDRQRLGKLIALLLEQSRQEDAVAASQDEKRRQELYAEFSDEIQAAVEEAMKMSEEDS